MIDPEDFPEHEIKQNEKTKTITFTKKIKVKVKTPYPGGVCSEHVRIE